MVKIIYICWLQRRQVPVGAQRGAPEDHDAAYAQRDRSPALRSPGAPVRDRVRVAHEVDAVLVEVRDSDGRSGWGEAQTSWRVTGESAASVTAAVEGPLGAAVVGLSADDPAEASAALERAVVRNSSARMAVECAVYDLAARAAGVPLFRYLGG